MSKEEGSPLDMPGVQEMMTSIMTGDMVSVVLEMEEEEFNIVSDILLNEFEKAFNRPNERMQLVEALRVQNLSVEDIVDAQANLINQIDDSFVGKISPKKIDFLHRITLIIGNAIGETDGVYKRSIAVPYVKVCDDALEPSYDVAGSPYLKIRSKDEIEIVAGKSIRVKTGLKFQPPKGYLFTVKTPQDLLLKSHLRLRPITIDYTNSDELVLVIDNTAPNVKDISIEEKIVPLYGEMYTIPKGAVIADLLLQEYPVAVLHEMVEEKQEKQEKEKDE